MILFHDTLTQKFAVLSKSEVHGLFELKHHIFEIYLDQFEQTLSIERRHMKNKVIAYDRISNACYIDSFAYDNIHILMMQHIRMRSS